MTSAPMSASIIVQIGPERIRERSTTNTSSSGRIVGIIMNLVGIFPHTGSVVLGYSHFFVIFGYKRCRFVEFHFHSFVLNVPLKHWRGNCNELPRAHAESGRQPERKQTVAELGGRSAARLEGTDLRCPFTFSQKYSPEGVRSAGTAAFRRPSRPEAAG